MPLYLRFANGTASFQFIERLEWIPALHAQYYLGVVGISLPLILLTAFMTVPVVIAGWSVVEKRPAQYFAAFLIMEGLMNGVFAALDSLLFYFFWEAMLIPMFVIIGIWGGPRRVYATLKFFLYTFLGSVLMLVALIWLYLKAGDYSIESMQQLPLTLAEQRWLFLAFLVAFAVKVPMFPAAHLAARRARGGAHRRLGDPGGHHAQDGWLRSAAFQPAHDARCQPRTRLAHHLAVADRHRLHRASWL